MATASRIAAPFPYPLAVTLIPKTLALPSPVPLPTRLGVHSHIFTLLRPPLRVLLRTGIRLAKDLQSHSAQIRLRGRNHRVAKHAVARLAQDGLHFELRALNVARVSNGNGNGFAKVP